jgi:hypothetical protein
MQVIGVVFVFGGSIGLRNELEYIDKKLGIDRKSFFEGSRKKED